MQEKASKSSRSLNESSKQVGNLQKELNKRVVKTLQDLFKDFEKGIKRDMKRQFGVEPKNISYEFLDEDLEITFTYDGDDYESVPDEFHDEWIDDEEAVDRFEIDIRDWFDKIR